MRILLFILLSFSAAGQAVLPAYHGAHYRAAPTPPVSTDPDATAFISAIEYAGTMLTPVQEIAIDSLVIDMKAAGVWGKMKAIYPFVGGTASAHKFNLKDPQDVDAAYRLIFVGNPTHSANGVDWNGTTQYAETNLVPSTELTIHNTHLSYYSREHVIENKYEMGAGTPYFDLGFYNGNLQSDHYNRFGSAAVPATTGHIISSRITNTSLQTFRNGALVQTVATLESAASLTTREIYLGALNELGSANFKSTKQCAFASIGEGLTTTEAANLYTAVQAYQTRLGRQM